MSAARVPAEGVPPEADAMRAELAALKPGALNKRAREVGIDADAVDDVMDTADDPHAAVVELILQAMAAGASQQPPPAAGPSAPPQPAGGNIKQRLSQEEWKGFPTTHNKWWQTGMAKQVNRLRAASRIRDSIPQEYRRFMPDLYPQLVVLGDGNTGKSSVLNRLAGFSFSAVTDGVCTRRPVRLQLRPLSAEHRERARAENLLAICTMLDTQDNFTREFTFRTAHREEDEDLLRTSVEERASAQVLQDGTAAAFDSQYITEELVITIEADQMIYFDLLDLPGLDNSSRMPHKMVRNYVKKDTLSRTFVLIFSDHKKGDTQLMHR